MVDGRVIRFGCFVAQFIETRIRTREIRRLVAVKYGQQFGDVALGRCFVQGHADGMRVERAQVDFVGARDVDDFVRGFVSQVNAQGVEKRRRPVIVPQPAQTRGQQARQTADAPRNLPQALRPVIDGIHRRHDGQQRLRRADVAGGFLAADVLLARLQGQAQGRPAVRVLGNADDAARDLALVRFACGEKRRVRPAVTQRHTEALGVADGDVGAELARREQQRQTEQISRDRDERIGGVDFLDERAVIVNRTVRGRILE